MPTSNKTLKNMNDLSDWVVNPETGRLLKIGTRKYYDLVKDKILKMDGGSRKKNVIYKGSNLDDVKKCMVPRDDNIKIIKRNETLIESRRKVTRGEIIKELCIKASDVIKNNMDDLEGLDGDALDKKVKQMINQKMVGDIVSKKKEFVLADDDLGDSSGEDDEE
jgi:hypothetical protein